MFEICYILYIFITAQVLPKNYAGPPVYKLLRIKVCVRLVQLKVFNYVVTNHSLRVMFYSIICINTIQNVVRKQISFEL